MTDLFDHAAQENLQRNAPLAARMRPRNISEYIGQEHIIGEGKLLRRAIDADRLFSSIILWGPPGTGKTTLARVIANQTKSNFETLSAIMAGKADLKIVIEKSIENFRLYRKRTVLFIDEIHRWNKAQQDALLPFVENGTITLIGATTENPFFEVIKALVSRSRIFQLRNLRTNELVDLLGRAIADKERGYGDRTIEISLEATDHLANMANGDARNILNALELAVESTPPNPNGVIVIDLEIAQESIQKRAVLYDKDGDSHYDTISAFIKSIRGSDPDAALYWLAKMIKAGEDPKFILRRLVVLSCEDIGLADPMGLIIANNAAQAFEFIGMPEGIYPIVQATLYLALADKSNTTASYFKTLQIIEEEGVGGVPKHLQDGNRDKEATGQGKDYVYPHDFDEHYVAQQYLPKRLLGTYFYEPTQMGYEKIIAERLANWRKQQQEKFNITDPVNYPEVPHDLIRQFLRNLG
jgi:putative ATPase